MKTFIWPPCLNPNLCSGCGTCAGMCPTNAIKMGVNYKKGIFMPVLENSKCDGCKICINVCPSYPVDFGKVDEPVPDKVTNNILLGNYINCYIGHSGNKKIRHIASSGGLITSLLIFALEHGLINGAILTRMKKRDPLKPDVFIAKTKEEIIEASGSKYCPVPVNTILRKTLEEDGKFAVVGLPCHIRGIRKAKNLKKKLKRKIILDLGIFCSHTVNFKGTFLLLEKLEINKESIKEIRYRGSGWPGNLIVTYKIGDSLATLQKSYPDYWFPLFTPYFFTPSSCMFCSDSTNEFADISIGDAWLPQIKMRDKEGTSIIISRTKEGEKILEEANKTNAIKLIKINPDDVTQSQWGPLEFKKISLKNRVSILKILGKEIPTMEIKKDSLTPNFLTYIVSALQLINSKLSERAFFYKFLKHLPFSALKIYAFLVVGLEYSSWKLAYFHITRSQR